MALSKSLIESLFSTSLGSLLVVVKIINANNTITINNKNETSQRFILLSIG
jgi:hypothetical protein